MKTNNKRHISIILDAFSHMPTITEQEVNIITGEINRIRNNLPPQSKEPCSGCNKKKEKFINEIRNNS